MKKVRSLLFCLVLVPYANDSLATDNLCKKGEINFSSCSVGKKIASFCVSGNTSVENAYIQYRFGTPKKVEFVFPADITQSKGLFFNSMGTHTDGAEMRLSFRSGDYHYIFFNIDSPHGDSGGIHVVKNGALIKELPCTNPTADQIPIPEGLIGNEEFK